MIAAKKKAIEKLGLGDLNIQLEPQIQVVKVEEPPKRQVGKMAVSYTHLRAHETKANLVCRLLLRLTLCDYDHT